MSCKGMQDEENMQEFTNEKDKKQDLFNILIIKRCLIKEKR